MTALEQSMAGLDGCPYRTKYVRIYGEARPTNFFRSMSSTVEPDDSLK